MFPDHCWGLPSGNQALKVNSRFCLRDGGGEAGEFPRWHCVKNLPANAGDSRDAVRSLGQEDLMEWEMATHASILAWEIPRTEEPGGLQSIELDTTE